MPYTPKPITSWQRLTLACGCTKDISNRNDDRYEVHEDYYCETLSGIHPKVHGLVIVTAEEDLSGSDVVGTVLIEAGLEFVRFRAGDAALLYRGGAKPITKEQWEAIKAL
jgi:hypothetical protein